MALEELSECVADRITVECKADSLELADAVNSFVCSLPLKEQQVFLCRYWYMDSVESIGRQFGFSQSKVKSMLYRTRAKLRTYLIKEGLQ